MNLGELVEGANILRGYFNDPDGYHCAAEHDVIYIGPTDNPVSSEHVARLFEMGWHQPKSEGNGEDNAPYDPEKEWAHFT